jgi:hypothetical protein
MRSMQTEYGIRAPGRIAVHCLGAAESTSDGGETSAEPFRGYARDFMGIPVVAAVTFLRSGRAAVTDPAA